MIADRDAARCPVHRIRLTGQLVRPKLLPAGMSSRLLLGAPWALQLLDCRSPDLPQECGAAQCVAILVDEDQAIWMFDRELP